MKTTRTIEISVETDEFFVIRRLGGPFVISCPQCGEQASMMTPEEASCLTDLSCREISRRVEVGLVHFSETPDGLLFICINSLCE